MLPSLPSLAPRDSYNLWYTPTHHTSIPSYHDTPHSSHHSHHHHHHDQFLPSNPHPSNNQNHGPQSRRQPHQHALHRTPLSRLVADETYQARRKSNIQNYGNSWLRPPGIPKSLFQLREEEREYREHQEALRREALAQELAEAEEAAQVEELMVPEDEVVRDLDDDIPEGMGEDEEEEDDEELDEDEDDEDGEEEEESEMDRAEEEGRARIVAQRMVDGFGMDGLGASGSESEEEDQDQMLQEEDLLHERVGRPAGGDTDMGGMDMDADLDDEVPEAEMGAYEHTDTEEECSSSEDESVDMGRLPLQTNFMSSMVRSDGTNSMELRSGSSLQGSSPRQATRARRGSRRG